MTDPERSLWSFTGLMGVDLSNSPVVRLPYDFFLSAKTPQLLSALNEGYMGSIRRMWWTQRLDAFFCLRSADSYPRSQHVERFQDGLMALQIIKPVQTLGLILQADDYSGNFSGVSAQERPQMSAGAWAELRRFDKELIAKLEEIIPKVLSRMQSGSAEQKNSVNMLQFSLEHLHPLVKGLFAVMGLEAVFDSGGRSQFRDALCDCLGESTIVFPDWNSPHFSPPTFTVGQIAIELYTLRSKIAHGVDLRKAAQDPKFPVDLLRKVTLSHLLADTAYCVALSEAAIYLLCEVIKKKVLI
jgi:hypothetical protein